MNYSPPPRSPYNELCIHLAIIALGILVIVLALIHAQGCNTYVVRDAKTFELEITASMSRQLAAMDALFLAADDANERGDSVACRVYAAPALLIESAAEHQGRKALFLAGLLEEDPGERTPPRAIEEICD